MVCGGNTHVRRLQFGQQRLPLLGFRESEPAHVNLRSAHFSFRLIHRLTLPRCFASATRMCPSYNRKTLRTQAWDGLIQDCSPKGASGTRTGSITKGQLAMNLALVVLGPETSNGIMSAKREMKRSAYASTPAAVPIFPQQLIGT